MTEKRLFLQRLHDVYLVFRRNVWMILGVTAIVVGITAFVTERAQRVYESEATLLVSEGAGGGMDLIGGLAALQGMGGLVGGSGAPTIKRDIELMRSRTMIESLVDTLSLQVRLVKSDSSRDEILSHVDVEREAPAGNYELRLQSQGDYVVTRVGAPIPGVMPVRERVQIGQLAQLPGLRFALNPALASRPPETIQLSVAPFRAAVSDVRSSLTVSQPDWEIPLVRLHYRSNDRRQAAQIPNALIDLFMQQQRVDSRTDARSYASFLREQSDRYEAELREVEGRLQAFQENTELISPEAQAELSTNKLVDLRSQRDQLVTQYQTLERILLDAEAEAQSTGNSTVPYRQLASYPAFMGNASVQKTLSTLLDLDVRREELLGRRTEQNLDVTVLNARIKDLEQSLRDLARQHLRSLRTQIAGWDGALARQGMLNAAIPGQQLELARLTRDQELLEQISVLVQTKLKEQEMQQVATTETARVLDPALVPLGPASPKPFSNLLAATIVGLLLGTVIAGARAYFDGTVRTQTDVQRVATGVPVLGLIPRHAELENGHQRLWGGRIRLFGSTNGNSPSEPLINNLEPDDPTLGAYRSLRAGLLRSLRDEGMRTLVVTSATAGEGKTTTAVNLALAFAQQGAKTLLIDADLRRSGVQKLLQMGAGPGLAEVLTQGRSLAESIRQVSPGAFGASLAVLPAGSAQPNSTELLGSEEMRRLLGNAASAYDVVVLDTPPLNLLTDAAVLSDMTDASVLVARAGRTQQPDLWAAAGQLRQARAALLGAILTGIRLDEQRYYVASNVETAHS